jgi:hypothetical protein
MKKIILTEEDIKSLENLIGNLPNFARTINETMRYVRCYSEPHAVSWNENS